MKRPNALVLLEGRCDAGVTNGSRQTDLRPLPVYCPLPQDEGSPRIEVAGWLAGKSIEVAVGVTVTLTWGEITGNASEYERSYPQTLIDPLNGARAGLLFVVRGGLPSALGLKRAYAAPAHEQQGLDIMQMNDRRSGLLELTDWGHTHPSLSSRIRAFVDISPGANEEVVLAEEEVSLGPQSVPHLFLLGLAQSVDLLLNDAVRLLTSRWLNMNAGLRDELPWQSLHSTLHAKSHSISS